MNRTALACLATFALTAVLFHIAPGSLAAGQVSVGKELPDCFSQLDIRFDESEGVKKPTPLVPKSWKFINASSGQKLNSNNLWFQDGAGNIFIMSGFNEGRTFILSPIVSELHATN